MVTLLIEKCGILFWPQFLLNIAVVALIAGHLLAVRRGEIDTDSRPWEDSLDPLAGMAVTLGLFGSVIGFISAFSGFQRGVEVSTLANGLSIAYWTTGVGIVTSLVATLGSYILNLINRPG